MVEERDLVTVVLNGTWSLPRMASHKLGQMVDVNCTDMPGFAFVDAFAPAQQTYGERTIPPQTVLLGAQTSPTSFDDLGEVCPNPNHTLDADLVKAAVEHVAETRRGDADSRCASDRSEPSRTDGKPQRRA